MKYIKLLCLVITMCGAVFCQDTGVAITGNASITKDYSYNNGFGGELHWFINVPQTLKINKNIVYIGGLEGFLQNKTYTNSGKGFVITNKARYHLKNGIFIEGGVKAGKFYTELYHKRAIFLLIGGGYKLNNHYIYYNIGKDVSKWTDDGINYISNNQTAHYFTYDTFLPLNKKLYMLYTINYTRGCGYNNTHTVKFCGNFYNFKAGVGIK